MFKYHFKLLINFNDKLNATQKLYFLKSTLVHALNVVSVEDSYETLFQALEFRFEYFIFYHQFRKILVFDSFNVRNILFIKCKADY